MNVKGCETLFLYLSLHSLFITFFSYVIINHSLVRRNWLITLCMLGISSLIAANYIFLSELFLFIFIALLNLKGPNEENIFQTMLKILLPFLISFIASFLLLPLNKFLGMVTASNLLFFWLLQFLGFALIFLLSLGAVKYLIPLITKYKKEKISFLSALSLYLIFQGLTTYRYFSDSFITFIIMVVTLLFVVLIYLMMQTLTQRQQLEVEIERQKIEQKYLEAYAFEMRQQYDELRKFKHDYVNILSSLEYFIGLGDLAKLQKYYQEQIQPTQQLLNQREDYFNDLKNIQSDEIKSILAVKLMLAKERNLTVEIEIPDKIANDFTVDYLVLTRMLGIILDNSIEEISQLKKGRIQVGLFDLEDHYLFVIKNTLRPNIEPLHLLKQNGFSTKGENRGLGLGNLKSLSQKEKGLNLETEITQTAFIQKIAVLKGEL